jgi:hypothetical protein
MVIEVWASRQGHMAYVAAPTVPAPLTAAELAVRKPLPAEEVLRSLAAAKASATSAGADRRSPPPAAAAARQFC